jgi:hypothetical protein
MKSPRPPVLGVAVVALHSLQAPPPPPPAPHPHPDHPRPWCIRKQLALPADFEGKSAGQQRNLLLALIRRHPGLPMCSDSSSCRCHAGGCMALIVGSSRAKHGAVNAHTNTPAAKGANPAFPPSPPPPPIHPQMEAPAARRALAWNSPAAIATAPPTPSPAWTLDRSVGAVIGMQVSWPWGPPHAHAPSPGPPLAGMRIHVAVTVVFSIGLVCVGGPRLRPLVTADSKATPTAFSPPETPSSRPTTP